MSSGVSLLIPAYNAARFVENIIADAKAQSPPFAEIIVYDDASTDKTAAKVRSLGVNHVIVGDINRGPSFARNQLLKASSQPWVHFHDADDRLDSNYLKAVTSASPVQGEMLFCGLRVFDARSQTYGNSYDYTHLNGVEDLGAFLQTSFQVGSGLYPADALRAIGGFRENIRGGEDLDLHVRLIQSGVGFRAIPDLLNIYCRYGNTTFTETNVGQLHTDLLYVYERYLQELPAAFRPLVAKLIMEQAYKLYSVGLHDESNKAVALAKSSGRHCVSSSHSVVRLLSLLIGAKAVFRLRKTASQFVRGIKGASPDNG